MLELNDQLKLSSKLLNISYEFAEKHYRIIENSDAIYVYNPEKGGDSIIVGKDGQVLYFDSSIGFDEAMEAYNNGIRTPLELFEEHNN